MNVLGIVEEADVWQNVLVLALLFWRLDADDDVIGFLSDIVNLQKMLSHSDSNEARKVGTPEERKKTNLSYSIS